MATWIGMRAEELSRAVPAGRHDPPVDPREVASLVLVPASPRTANVTGSSYAIDGGLVKPL
jgi:NAD(P)-dependent dehydrogenase (short-subunit alcohol dehydrogenase family)